MIKRSSMKILRVGCLQLKRRILLGQCGNKTGRDNHLWLWYVLLSSFCSRLSSALVAKRNLFSKIRRSSFVEQRASTSSGIFKTGWLVETQPNSGCLLIIPNLFFYCMKKELASQRRQKEKFRNWRINTGNLGRGKTFFSLLFYRIWISWKCFEYKFQLT